MLTHDPGGDYYCTVAGRKVGQLTVKELLVDGFLVPANDGLFAGHSQVFVPK